jgi:hypothetical protein
MAEDDLRALLETLDPKARDDLRRVLIRDQADRDAVASQLLRYRDGHGNDWADISDMLTMHPDARRQVVRLLGEAEAERSNLRRTRPRGRGGTLSSWKRRVTGSTRGCSLGSPWASP